MKSKKIVCLSILLLLLSAACRGPASQNEVCDSYDALSKALREANGLFDNALFERAADLGSVASRYEGNPEVTKDAENLKKISESKSTSSVELQDATIHISRECNRAPLAINALMNNDKSETRQTTSPTPTIPEICGKTSVTSGGGLSFLSAEATFTQMLTNLRELKSSRDNGISKAADRVIQAFDNLKPKPKFVYEALGRMTFKGLDFARLLDPLAKEITSACNPGGSRQSVAYLKEQITPRPEGAGFVTDDVYGKCKDFIGAIAPRSLVYDCGGGEIAKVDLGSGVVERASGFPKETENADALDTSDLQIVRDRIVWVSRSVTPAQGLSLPKWSATLHVRETNGSAVADTVFVSQEEASSPPGINQLVPKKSPWPSTLGVVVAVAFDEIGYYNSDGKLLWRQKWKSPTSVDYPTPSTVSGYGENVVLDVATGDEVINGPGGHKAEPCGHGYYGKYSGEPTFWLDDDLNRVSKTPVPEPLVPPDSARFTSTGWTNSDYVGQSVASFRPDGTRAWSIPEGVLRSHVTVGKWVVGQNASDKVVLIDAEIGKESSPKSAELKAFLTAKRANPQLLAADPGKNAAIGRDSEDGLVFTVPFRELCG